MGKESDKQLLLATMAAALTILAVAFIVANMRYFDLGEGGDRFGPVAYQIAQLLGFVLGAIFVLLMVYMLLIRTRRKGMPMKGATRGPRRMSGFILFFAIIGALLIFATVTDGRIIDLTPEDQNPSGPGDDDGNNNPIVAPGGEAGALAIVAFLIVLTVLAVGGGSKYIRRRPLRVSRAALALEGRRAQAIVDQALQDIYNGEDPRSVIVRTYQRTSRLISRRLQEAPYLTPRELASVAEIRFGWPSRPTEELTSLFEEAWYSDHQLTEAKKERALSCLREISESHRSREGGEGAKVVA